MVHATSIIISTRGLSAVAAARSRWGLLSHLIDNGVANARPEDLLITWHIVPLKLSTQSGTLVTEYTWLLGAVLSDCTQFHNCPGFEKYPRVVPFTRLRSICDSMLPLLWGRKIAPSIVPLLLTTCHSSQTREQQQQRHSCRRRTCERRGGTSRIPDSCEMGSRAQLRLHWRMYQNPRRAEFARASHVLLFRRLPGGEEDETYPSEHLPMPSTVEERLQIFKPDCCMHKRLTGYQSKTMQAEFVNALKKPCYRALFVLAQNNLPINANSIKAACSDGSSVSASG